MTARLLLAAALLCAPPAFANPSAEAKKAIEANNARMGEAVAKGDADTIAALYDEQAIVMPDGAPEVKGREAIKQMFAGLMKGGAKKLELTAGDVQVSGDFATETGTYSITLAPQGKPEITGAGKYLVVWKKSHGKWHMLRDIWNMNGQPKGDAKPDEAPQK